ncbi:MAG: Tex family protein [Bacteroidia bacterium]
MHTDVIARELSLSPRQVAATLTLIAEGATIPFMARYRKEVTGSLDEVQLAQIRDRAEQLDQLDKRREAILKSLEERQLLTDDLRHAIGDAATLATLEDIYLPYRPKRRTRATIARERGLEPLAQQLFAQAPSLDPEREAAAFVDAEKEVPTTADALQGARDIIAEWVNEDRNAREQMRQLFAKEGVVSARLIPGKEEEGAKYRDYFTWSEGIAQIPSHRLLALRRAEKEGILSLTIEPDETEAVARLERLFVKGQGAAAGQVREAVQDSYKRLMAPSIETETRIATKDRADEEAIRVFVENLRQLLLAAPLGQKPVLALDPGFRTGCKLVCLDAQGNLLENTTIYPHPPQRHVAQAEAVVAALVQKHRIEVVAIGNGTASRETETFVKGVGLPPSVSVVMVSEAGASVYSASDVAREEFPDHDVTVRGAISIGRRLMDPLAELVKIDPKSIGVGQYQHDVDQNQLKKSLDDTVVSCVNAVGVEVNTASKQLLTYVSGLGPSLAENIVRYRAEAGAFRRREDLKKVPRLGPKAFEQCAGFLRIRDAAHPLDASAVHPERYALVEQMAADLGVSVRDLMQDDKLRKRIDLRRYESESVGMPTLRDIMEELAKPGRDPREQFELFQFAEGINEIKDLREGMVLPGIVTNITAFGAFVDIGVHQDGLVHLSQLADRYVKDPNEVVKVHQKVTVKVVSVDTARRRIALTMKTGERPVAPPRERREQREAPPRDSDFIRSKPEQRRKK